MHFSIAEPYADASCSREESRRERGEDRWCVESMASDKRLELTCYEALDDSDIQILKTYVRHLLDHGECVLLMAC